MGSLAVEGPLVRWVADHRKHHKFSDAEGDPHSPWRFGETVPALMKGLWWAHIGWMFDEEQTPQDKYAPDLIKDKAIRTISRQFALWTVVSLLLPPLIGGLVTMSWWGAFTAFFWGSLVRVALLHHVTWSINSICHAVGKRPFRSRDRSGNVWWLAILSCGESWHNLHHADPTSARHGVMRGQLDSSARFIRWFERLGWAYDVRWPSRSRIDSRRNTGEGGSPAPDGGRRGGMIDAVATDSSSTSGNDKQRRTRRTRMTGAERRQQLLEIGRTLFAAKGFEGTSVEEIAAKAGVSKPVVYEHFGGKEGAVRGGGGPRDAPSAGHGDQLADRGSSA